MYFLSQAIIIKTTTTTITNKNISNVAHFNPTYKFIKV